MARTKQQKKIPGGPRTANDRGKGRAAGLEEQPKRDPSPAREAGDSNERRPGRGSSSGEDERVNLADVQTPDDAPAQPGPRR